MNQQYKKGDYARRPRDHAGATIASILKSKIRDRPFDAIAYAAALDVLG